MESAESPNTEYIKMTFVSLLNGGRSREFLRPLQRRCRCQGRTRPPHLRTGTDEAVDVEDLAVLQVPHADLVTAADASMRPRDPDVILVAPFQFSSRAHLKSPEQRAYDNTTPWRSMCEPEFVTQTLDYARRQCLHPRAPQRMLRTLPTEIGWVRL
jgi:hypothetical protein